jgi:hypothetical protein
MILQNIHCIQFYLYEKSTVTLAQISGIFGPNGAGKSSFIDAVQIAVFGGNQNLVALNAQADDKTKSTRTIRGYCLGQYDAQAHQRVRERATTYITLVWRDPKTNRPVSMGLCIAASGDEEGHEILGRFVADGVEISLSDHLSLENGVERPREWKAFRADLTRRVERVNGRLDEVFFDNSDRYMKAFLTLMSHGKDAGSISLFKRAFRFGLRMRFEKSVDAIVRDEVLEHRPTNVKAFKEVMETFRNLRVLVESVEKKIESGEEILAFFSDADKFERRAAAWSILESDVIADKTRSEANSAADEAQNARKRWEEIIEKRKAVEDQIAALDIDESRLKALRDSHTLHNRLAYLNTSIENGKKHAAHHQDEAHKRVDELVKVLIKASSSVDLRDQSESLRLAADRLRNVGIKPGVSFEAEVSYAVEQARDAWSLLLTQRQELSNALGEKNREIDGLEENIKRAKTGKAPLPNNTMRLMRYLGDHGIEAVPVCDLAQVSDLRWQPVIESFLGEPNLVALLVSDASKENEKNAFRLYRQLDGKGAIYGIKLLMPSRIKMKPVARGSVAELIVGENPVAVAFLSNLFGDIRRAEANDEAMSGGRALTPDGMYVGRDTFERRRPVPTAELRLGAQSESHAANLTATLLALKHERTCIEESISRVATLMTVLGAVPADRTLNDAIRSDLTLVLQFQQDVLSSQTSMEQPGAGDYQNLCMLVIEIGEQIKGVRKHQIEVAHQEGKAESEFSVREASAKKASKAADIAHELSQSKQKSTVFDAEYAASRWDEMLEEHQENWDAMLRHCKEQYKNRSLEMNGAVNKGQRALEAFVQVYRETPGPAAMEDWRQANPWVKDIVDRLKNTELTTYRDQMIMAERASQDTFRTDVALTLHNNLVWLDQQMKRLNSVLSISPAFSNGERYSFKRTVRKDYEELLRFVENVAANGSEENLFGGPGEVPAQFLELLEEITAPGSAGARSPIEDYREFFEFDVNILREVEEGGTPKVVSQLSKRIGHGSGGEHRAPLYVIAGAALASAYDLDGRHDGGIRLILLDEAFNKMDIQNIIATMRYLESLGLQIFLASPGENLATLTAFLHRYYQILRDAEHNVVMLEGYDISKEARDMMRSDLPEFHPELVDREMSTTQKVA